MKRRYFVNKITSSTIFGLSFPLSSLNNTDLNIKKITILHTNDVHSHIDPFPKNDPLNPLAGGVIARAKLINDIKKENPLTLVFDAGDIFQGTPYFNFFKGEIELKLMSKLGYNASTLGNHEFDNGINQLAKSMEHANFPFINSNYYLKNTPLENKIETYKIFVLDGIKIGVFGIGIELKGLVDEKLYHGVKYLDPIEISSEMTNKLKHEKNCDIIICLSHLGYDTGYNEGKMCDIFLAKKTKDIDLIIGGHSHTFMKKPITFKNLIGKNVILNQVGCYGLSLGKIDFYLSEAIKQKSSINLDI